LAEIKDLTQVNEELEIEDDLIEVSSLGHADYDETDIEGVDRADLDAVSEQVEVIEQNIKKVFSVASEESSEAIEKSQVGNAEIGSLRKQYPAQTGGQDISYSGEQVDSKTQEFDAEKERNRGPDDGVT
jgi:hypothetical protein